MERICIILLITSLGYISGLVDINDISLSTEFLIDSKEFPNNTLPIDSVFYFRLEVADENKKIIKLKANKNDSFIVKMSPSEDKPEIQFIDPDKLNELELQKSINDSEYYIHYYHFHPEENNKYILISVALKENLNYFSLYIENDESKAYEITTIKAEYSTKYQVNLTDSKSQHPELIIELNKSHIGETFLNFIVNHNDTPVDFRVFAFGHQYNSEKVKNIELYDDSEPGNNIYKYKFYLDEKISKIYIKVEFNKKINFSFYLNYAKTVAKDEIINIYNIDYSKLYNMEGAIYGPDKSRHIMLKPKSEYIGDVYILLKVDNNTLDNDFDLYGYGAEDPRENNKVNLDVKYNKIYYEGNYNIIEYHFKPDKKTAFFTINANVPNYSGYLSIKFNKKSFDEIEDQKSTAETIFYVLITIILLGLFITWLFKR